MDRVVEEVKKPVEAIQCANAFSLLQRKMYNVLLANAVGNLRPEVTHRISIGILCKLMGYKSRDYETIKNRFRDLRRMDIEWDIINEDGNKVWTNTSPLSLARVIAGEGICEYEFTKSLIPYLDRPAQYAKFSLAIQSKFKSSYGLALYENCERYRKLGYTKAFDVPTFRKLMGIHDDQYTEFFAMKRRVIDQAVKEVNKHADFEVVPEYEKAGKVTVKIRFGIQLKKTFCETKLLSGNEFSSELTLLLKQVFSCSDNEIQNLIKKYSAEYIKEKINYIFDTKAYKSGDIANLGAYLTRTLSCDYKVQKSSREITQELKQKQDFIQEKEEKLKKRYEEARYVYSKNTKNKIIEIISNFKDDLKQEFTQRFEKYLYTNDLGAYSIFRQKGFMSILVYGHLQNFIKEYYPHVLDNIQTFENQLQELYPEIHSYHSINN